MNNRRNVWGASLAFVFAAALAGCGMMPKSNVDHYTATMGASQEVPPNTSTATGTAEVTFDRSSRHLTWRVTYSGLTGPATLGHIHGPALPGANAGVAVPFKDVANQPIMGEATITEQQAADLAAGKWYVNIHTAKNPGGEIRGQLAKR